MMKKNLLAILMLCCASSISAQQNTIDLSGMWRFQSDLMGFGKTPGSELYLDKLSETIVLPGTTDEGGKGIQTNARHVDRLSRKFEYCGQAWYQREVVIPRAWENKEITLFLERCHWETTVYVDGKLVGSEEYLGTPNRFLLTKQMTPGTHTLTICVDNRLKYPMDQWNHGTSEYTQTNWNGIVGRIELLAQEKSHIKSVKAYPDAAAKKVRLDVLLTNTSKEAKSGMLHLSIREKGGATINSERISVHLNGGDSLINQEISFGKSVKLWDEFNPNLYEATATLTMGDAIDEEEISFGVRKVEQGKHHIRLNNRDIHLRGALDCCVFPLTGYPPTDVAEWKRVFTTVKDYGMNHIRFHSWCPPKAAFTAADELGLYLQAELPMWIKDVGQYPARRDYFEKEMYAILEEYGNHPSFILMCNGNENEGNFDVLEDLVKKAQKYDNRRLYSASTARTHTASDQYYTSHVTSKGWITVYEGRPSTDWDRSKESDIDCPVIAHETGQRCMFPNFDEIKKYTGVLVPRNFEVFRERLARNGMLHQADDFFKATGMHTVLQYKEVNEALLRTRNSGGFQLLGLSDFPGQGTALVGVLDAFWESKGLVAPETYRESCAPTVLLARLPKRTYTTDETFTAKMEVYHYGENPIKSGKLVWSLEDENKQIIRKGKISTSSTPCATVKDIGAISVDLANIEQPTKLTLHATLNGQYHNEWDIWVYPQEKTQIEGNYLFARAYDNRVKEALEAGKSVLLVPEKVTGRKTKFAGHFWNPIMFNWNPMIVGTLIDHQHPSLKAFPTNYYADWQWWDILNNSTALSLADFDNITPVIQSVDSYEYNEKLGIAFEASVAKGKLFVLAIDLIEKTKDSPAVKQLLHSVTKYVASEEFTPDNRVEFYQLDKLFDMATVADGKKKNDTAVKQLLNH